jgi:hypothetical protein
VSSFYRVATKVKSTQSIERGSKHAIKGERVGAKAKQFLFPASHQKERNQG